ncbi:hypothetical protein [Methylobacterium soli]|uniref:Porin n=1 Tax=Methylobacterium soli TaxID=553447 RepID=A0A6L3SX08_9HYPH|nr:hypothetical protein [Methylobacterium soli]KAB1077515.1 hypothetical protein F6X53_18560 [Methylobacterium soli]GJE44995.1 hypothetical protein AEGHOMDF_4189 [Methylobacterium soli]
MSIFVPLSCVSAALAAGLVLTMAGTGNAPALAAPAVTAPVATAPVAAPVAGAACRQAAWPFIPAACAAAAGARPVRLIALGEAAPASPARGPGLR